MAAGWCLNALSSDKVPSFIRTTIDAATDINPAPSQSQRREVENLLSQASEVWPVMAPLGSCRRQARDNGGRIGNAILKIGEAIAKDGYTSFDADQKARITWNPLSPDEKPWSLVNACTVNAVQLAADIWRLVRAEVSPKVEGGQVVNERQCREDYGNEIAALVGKFRNAVSEALAHEWEMIPAPQVEQEPAPAQEVAA